MVGWDKRKERLVKISWRKFPPSEWYHREDRDRKICPQIKSYQNSFWNFPFRSGFIIGFYQKHLFWHTNHYYHTLTPLLQTLDYLMCIQVLVRNVAPNVISVCRYSRRCRHLLNYWTSELLIGRSWPDNTGNVSRPKVIYKLNLVF